MQEEMFEGKDGVKLFARSWRPDGPARAVIVIVHGFKAHSGLYEWPGAQLAKQGFAVFALDLRGHGRSEGEPLFIEKFTDYTADVDRLVQLAHAREPDAPIFILGHSAGGVISSGYALEHQDKLAGFICESFAQEVPAPDLLLTIVKGISHVAPHIGVLDLKDDDFSRDPAFVERMKSDPLVNHDKYPSNTVAEMARAEDRLASDKGFAEIKLPVLIMHGTLDKVTKPHGSQLFYDTAGSTDKTLRLYDGYFHDLLNDIGKEAVLADISQWITARVTSGPQLSH